MKTILENANRERWLSIYKYLTYLAEASPSMFLKGIENDLNKEDPEIKVLMRSIDDEFSGICLRSHLLWALEKLAWHEQYFTRVVKILFQLQPFEVKDSWSNTSFDTANSLFRVWLPSTEVSINKRFEILRNLNQDFRNPVIDVCLSLLPKRTTEHGMETSRPKWNLLEKVIHYPNWKEVDDSHQTSRNLLIELSPYNTEELKKVLEVMLDLGLEQTKELENEVKRWAKTATDDEKISAMDSLRSVIKRLNYLEDKDLPKIWEAVENIKNNLEPILPSSRHRWLFNEHYIDWTLVFDKAVVERPSHEESENKIKDLRQRAVNEILQKQGQEAMLEFIFEVNNPKLISYALLPKEVTSENGLFG